MRSTHQYQPAPGRTAQTLHESAVVAGAITHHRREATLRGRTEEAHQMDTLLRGVRRMALECTRAYQPASDAA